MTETEEIGWQQLKIKGLVQPGIQQLLSGAEGVVKEDGTVTCDAIDDTLVLAEKGAIPAGTDVDIKVNRNPVCKPKAAAEREKKKKQAKRRAKAWERRKQREQREQERKEFWDQYQIPIDFGVGQNNRISELRRGSTGTGTTSSTVKHFIVAESFKEGRLERDEKDFLCRNKGEYADTGLTTDAIEKDTPSEVTCKACLKLMERWKHD